MYTFGISGRLYKSNVLLYDRETESLWSQILREAVTGPRTGARLNPIPSSLTTWKRWRDKHPETLVLSTRTGYSRDYTVDPYKSYHKSRFPFFGSAGKKSSLVDEKELVLGIEFGGVSKAYPFKVLKGREEPLTDTVAGRPVTVYFDKESEEAFATDADGKRLPGFVSYWFVWHSFHPESEVYSGAPPP